MPKYSIRIPTHTFLAGTASVLLLELLATNINSAWHLNRWLALGLVRSFEAMVIIGLLAKTRSGLSPMGVVHSRWQRGIVRGAWWAAGCGTLTLLLCGLGQLLGLFSIDVFQIVLPENGADRVLFFMVGGLVAPVAEELFFRGLVYNFFRRWGWSLALILSTALFVWSHATHGLPFTQLIGGIVFAAAYEIEKNLMVPIIIHSSGNLAIFTLSLL